MAIILQLKSVDKFYSGTPILRNVNMNVNEKERVGLVGPNGAGKTTLLKVITSEIQADQGEIYCAKKARIGYLAQDGGLDSEQTIWEEVLAIFEPIRKIENQLRQLEQEMGNERVLQDQNTYQRILRQYSQLQEAFEEKEGYSYEARIRSALHGLGLGDLDWAHTPITHLSGGQKTRLALAKLLLEAPDLLILDEPTNHLDLEALTWLEQTLNNYTGALLVVSHDRYFLDRFVETIYEVDRTRVTRYPGNYSSYVKERATKIARWEKEYEQQQGEIQRMEEFIQRNLARASTTKRAQSRRKALERMERIATPPKQEKKAGIRFATSTTSGRQVLQVEDLAIGYEESPLITSLSFQLLRGERVALIGPNGIGKTTLLKTLAGHLPPCKGEVHFGTGVELDYYDQEQQDLDPTASVLDEVWNAHPTLDQTTIRSYLGQFLFSGDEVFKQVRELSGGEKARLSLAKRMLQRANFLLMDEPTNHLDMNSKERLEEALTDFPGTLLFVSHDRYFINRLATRIIELQPDGFTDFPGNYDFYLEKKRPPSPKEVSKEKKSVKKVAERQKETLRRQREVAQLEAQIEALEADLEAVKLRLCQPEIFNNHEESRRLQLEMEEIEERLAKKTERWVDLAE